MEPHIFGSLLEGALATTLSGHSGPHYTHQDDILEVVGPSITAPWQERVENADSTRS